MNLNQIQEAITNAPIEHDPCGYAVTLTDKTGKVRHTRYVRASSEKRARLTALRTERGVFGYNNTFVIHTRKMDERDCYRCDQPALRAVA